MLDQAQYYRSHYLLTHSITHHHSLNIANANTSSLRIESHLHFALFIHRRRRGHCFLYAAPSLPRHVWFHFYFIFPPSMICFLTRFISSFISSPSLWSGFLLRSLFTIFSCSDSRVRRVGVGTVI